MAWEKSLNLHPASIFPSESDVRVQEDNIRLQKDKALSPQALDLIRAQIWVEHPMNLNCVYDHSQTTPFKKEMLISVLISP